MPGGGIVTVVARFVSSSTTAQSTPAGTSGIDALSPSAGSSVSQPPPGKPIGNVRPSMVRVQPTRTVNERPAPYVAAPGPVRAAATVTGPTSNVFVTVTVVATSSMVTVADVGPVTTFGSDDV